MRETRQSLFTIDAVSAVIAAYGAWGLATHASLGFAAIVPSIVCLAIAITGWAYTERMRRTVRFKEASAKETSRNIQQAVYSGAVQEFRLVNAADYPGLDHYFYDQTQLSFEGNGFRTLGDLENVTLTKVLPNSRKFRRAMVGPNGDIVASIIHIKSRVANKPDRRLVELQSELSDGSYINTNNSSNATISRSEPRLTHVLCASQTSFEEMIRIHRDARAGVLVSRPTIKITCVENVDDYIHLQQRFHGVLSENAKARDFAKVDPKEAAARDMLERQKGVYSGKPHEYRMVTPAEFPNLDHAFYDRFKDFFAGRGFRFAWDRENLTLSRLFPHMRSFVRSVVSDDGTMVGFAYHKIIPNGEIRNMDLDTELSDGTYVITTTASNTTLPFPGFDQKHCPSKTSAEELLRIHQERVAAALAARPGIAIVKIMNNDDLLQSIVRQQSKKAKHKQSTGLLNAEDIKKIKGRQLLPHEQAVVVELEKIKQAEQIGPTQ